MLLNRVVMLMQFTAMNAADNACQVVAMLILTSSGLSLILHPA